MTKITGGEAVVQALIDHGVDILFGLPGIQNDWLYNALYDQRDKIKVIHTRHEQEAGYMALGYALATGRKAVFNIVPGPGFLNAGAALATAYALNAPVLCLVGQIPSHQIGREMGTLHEIPDQFGMLQRLTKWAGQIKSPAEAPMMVAEAFRQMASGRPRPVGLEVSMDVLAGKAVVDTTPLNLPPYNPPVDEVAVAQAGKLLGEAKRPLIYTGSGAQGVSEGVRELAHVLEAPVVGYRTGQGVMDGRSHLSLHMPPSHELWKTADVVLALGTNLRIPSKWGVDDNLKIIRIDVDPTAHNRIMKPHLPITARLEDTLPLLLTEVAKWNGPRESREVEMRALKADWQARTAFMEPQLSFLKVIREELGEKGIFVDELTQVGFTSRITYPVYNPRTFISTGYQGTLGYGFPTALGVKVARPDAPVVSVAGDGGFMFGVQALATAVQHRIPLVTIVFNNNQYGNVRQMQKNVYGNRLIATELVNPDFVQLAHAFGAHGQRVETPAALAEALRQGFAAELPTLIEVPVGDMPSVDRFRKLGKVR